VPAYSRAHRILVDTTLLELVDLPRGERGYPASQRGKKRRKLIRISHGTPGVIVTQTERDDPPIAQVPVKLERFEFES
jgi:hypothetical protein